MSCERMRPKPSLAAGVPPNYYYFVLGRHAAQAGVHQRNKILFYTDLNHSRLLLYREEDRTPLGLGKKGMEREGWERGKVMVAVSTRNPSGKARHDI